MADGSAARTSGRRASAEPAPRRALLVPAVALASLIAIAAGWRMREDAYLVPDRGLGYALGIVGLSMMSLLLLYSLRKRMRWLRGLGAVRYWFEIHMLLGIVGPLAILFHANFQVKSVNAGVALVCMLVVAGSGFIGRFAYARVHHGLFGHRESLAEVSERAEASRSALHTALRAAPGVEACVREFESQALARSPSALGQLGRVFVLGQRTRATSRRARRLLRKSPPGSLAVPPDVVARALRRHLALVRRVAEFGFYERVLSLWHALHVPLAVVLFTAAVVHVIAVNLY
jgi:hypothetical protein